MVGKAHCQFGGKGAFQLVWAGETPPPPPHPTPTLNTQHPTPNTHSNVGCTELRPGGELVLSERVGSDHVGGAQLLLLSAVGCEISKPKSSRKGFEKALRLDAKSPPAFTSEADLPKVHFHYCTALSAVSSVSS